MATIEAVTPSHSEMSSVVEGKAHADHQEAMHPEIKIAPQGEDRVLVTNEDVSLSLFAYPDWKYDELSS